MEESPLKAYHEKKSDYPKIDFPFYTSEHTTRHNHPTSSGVCFSIDNMISKEEIEYLIPESEKLGYKSVEWEYDPKYRNCDRLVTIADELSRVLWHRLTRHLILDDIHNIKPYGIATDGVWVPSGINDCIRFSKYYPGGHFKKHRDGGFVIDDNNRSVFTILIYLNEEFSGGETLVFEKDRHFEVKPRPGMALIFNHDLEHCGNPVLDGCKYILRTDIMFRRIDQISRFNYTFNKEYRKAEDLYKDSIRFQLEGRPRESTNCYLAAMEIHSKYGSVKKQYITTSNLWSKNIPDVMTSNIVDYLITRDHSGSRALAMLLKLNKSWQKFIIYCNLWRSMYHKKFWASQSLIYSKSILNDSRWYYYYRSRCFAEKNFNIFSIYIGYNKTYYWLSGNKVRDSPKVTNNMHQRIHAYNPHGVPPLKVNQGEGSFIPSKICKCRGHNWGAGSGVDQWIVGNQVLDDPYGFVDTENIRYPWYSKTSLDFLSTKVIIGWLFNNGFSESMKSGNHPILLAIPYYISDLDRQRITSLLLQNSEVTKWNQPSPTNAPFVCLKERELLALDACDLDTGIVIFLDNRISTIVSIKFNKIIEAYCYSMVTRPKIIEHINNLVNLQFMSGTACYKDIIIVSDEEKEFNEALIDELNKFTLNLECSDDDMQDEPVIRLNIDLGSITTIHLVEHKSILYYSNNKPISEVQKDFIKNPF